jgi:hypothetical protein
MTALLLDSSGQNLTVGRSTYWTARSKCEIISNDTDLVKAFRPLLSATIHVDLGDSTVIGAPVGGSEITKFCRGIWMNCSIYLIV